MPEEDPSNGYEAVAQDFMTTRGTSGQALVRKWAASLPRGASVVDVGAGFGEPLTTILIETGLTVSAIDAAPSMVTAFKKRFPDAEVACEPAEHSPFFNRKFDAALAVGLVFLLPEQGQAALLNRIAGALKPGGRLLFSAPWQKGEWDDVLTGRRSLSLGEANYRHLIANAGLKWITNHSDEGGSHYYEARKKPG